MDPLKSRIGIADPQDPQHNRYVRNLRSTDQLLKQFCRYESSVDKAAYDRGWIWNFEWNSTDPKKARPDLVQAVEYGMKKGMLFEQAFDVVKIADDAGVDAEMVIGHVEAGESIISVEK